MKRFILVAALSLAGATSAFANTADSCERVWRSYSHDGRLTGVHAKRFVEIMDGKGVTVHTSSGGSISRTQFKNACIQAAWEESSMGHGSGD